jgi:hypothetical protein
VRAVVSLAWARLRHRPLRWLLVALGVAAATILPVSAQATSTVVAAQALRHGLAALPVGDRSLAAIRSGLRESPADIAALDHTARDSFAPLAAGPIVVEMLGRSISDRAGNSFYFGAVDDLAGKVRLTGGRLPASCTPTRCEVVAVGTTTADVDPALGLVVVGRAVRTDPLLFGGSFDPGDGAPLLIADGVDTAAQLDSLSAFQRNYAWVTAIDLDRVDELGVDGYLARSTAASIELYGARLTLSAPDEVLRSEADRAQRSARRFALLNGAAMALLLGFAAIGAIGVRRDHTATVELLRRRGATRGQTAVLAGICAVVPVVVGAAVGVAAGGLLGGWQARGGGLSAGTVGLAAIRAGLPTAGVAALAAALVVGLTLSAGRDGNGRNAWRAVDIVIVVGVIVAALSIARGVVTEQALAGGTDPLLLALPVIAVVCGGLAVGRVWPWLTGALARLVPRRLLAPRLGLLGAVRSPLRPVATAAFLAAATGIVAFAGSYQSTLARGAVDQATFAVPLDATVQTGQNLRPPLDVSDVDGYAAAGAAVHDVVRAPATIRVNASQSITPEVVGVDPAAVTLIPSWSTVVGAGDPGQVGRTLAAARPAGLPGVALPAGTRDLAFTATGPVSDLDLSAWVRLPDGRDAGVPLTLAGAGLTGQLPAAVPAGSVLFAITVTENEFANTRRQHRAGEGTNEVEALTGQITLAGVDFTGWGAAGGDTATGATVTAGPTGLTLAYQLTGNKVVLRAGNDVPEPALPVYVDPTTAAAAAGGALSLQATGSSPIPAQIAGVLPRFPSTDALFVVTDVEAVADALDRREPGTGAVSELWLSATSSPAALGRALTVAPFDLLAVDLRQSRVDRLAGDPVAQGATGLLRDSAVLAFVVALVALVLLVLAERRDDSASLYAWESDGVAPAALRRSLFLRAVAVVVVGVPGGVLIGLALSRITAALVRLTATGADPVPPLALEISPLWTVELVGAGVVAGLVVCGLVCAASLRERLPRRPEEGLR